PAADRCPQQRAATQPPAGSVTSASTEAAWIVSTGSDSATIAPLASICTWAKGSTLWASARTWIVGDAADTSTVAPGSFPAAVSVSRGPLVINVLPARTASIQLR